MNLKVEIKPDFHGSVAIIDRTQDLQGGYLNDDAPLQFDSFTWEDTCAIDVLTQVKTSEEKQVEIIYTDHDSGTDSVRIPLKEDGYYIINHIVLPTNEWLEKAKEDNTIEEQGILYYINIDEYNGYSIRKFKVDGTAEIDVASSIDEVIQVGPQTSTNHNGSKTISLAQFNVFCIDKLKHCYKDAACEILDNLNKCDSDYENKRFTRDFLWMTINVINMYLEEDMYGNAQQLLENVFGYHGSYHHEHKRSCSCHR